MGQKWGGGRILQYPATLVEMEPTNGYVVVVPLEILHDLIGSHFAEQECNKKNCFKEIIENTKQKHLQKTLELNEKKPEKHFCPAECPSLVAVLCSKF